MAITIIIILNTELPYPPSVMVNITTGEVNISSRIAEGIELDHYKITLSDVTNFTVYHDTLRNGLNSTSFGTIFQQHICSPYNVTVSAYSVMGTSISTTKIIGTAENNGTLTKIYSSIMLVTNSYYTCR